MENRKIIERFIGGDVKALGKVIDTYSAYLYAIVYNIAGESLSREDAEEIVADSFVSLWYNRLSADSGSFKSYLAAIARNKTKDALRAQHLTEPLEDDIILARCSAPEEAAVKSELSKEVRSAVETLPEPDREIFKRHYFLYQKTDEIAADMSIKPATVRVKLSRGREKLRGYLRERGVEYENINN
jgi:RNA polymerase sigma factor (sigma-70 family)